MWRVMVVAAMSAVVAVGQELPVNTDEIKTLTVVQAQALAQHEGGLSLNGLTTLSDEAAQALRRNLGVYLPTKFSR